MKVQLNPGGLGFGLGRTADTNEFVAVVMCEGSVNGGRDIQDDLVVMPATHGLQLGINALMTSVRADVALALYEFYRAEGKLEHDSAMAQVQRFLDYCEEHSRMMFVNNPFQMPHIPDHPGDLTG